jgi:ElaB/YqjD/DUF883 family membrane-anchored ribosome-binding protein
MEKLFEQMKSEFTSLSEEMEKVKKGNAAAGTRARKHCMNLMTGLKQLRKDIQESKKS